MRSTIVDSGPLIALFDRDDKHHQRVKTFLSRNRLRLITTWPVLTETTALLPSAASMDFLEFVCRGGLEVRDLGAADLRVILALSRKYADVPMDFTDSSLVALALREGYKDIVSLDRDFDIYRLAGKRRFRNLLSTPRA